MSPETPTQYVRENFWRWIKRWGLFATLAAAVNAPMRLRGSDFSGLEMIGIALGAWILVIAGMSIVIAVSLVASFYMRKIGITLPEWMTRERG